MDQLNEIKPYIDYIYNNLLNLFEGKPNGNKYMCCRLTLNRLAEG